MSLLFKIVANSVQLFNSFNNSVAILVLFLVLLIAICASFNASGLLLSLITFCSLVVNAGSYTLRDRARQKFNLKSRDKIEEEKDEEGKPKKRKIRL
ncbi:hypothetical protein F8M41_001666 [Gigaspora margarita]|uniref:Uncharacterized protein n=1 Tax=Gigaspora margarita TaxID=4874 RepID=A0A8H4A9U7_GIGMA|nr:hypothetical protein F8M41_001666 [Gigaspora margarita]